MSAFDTHARLRRGDASAWPRLRPEFLSADEVMEAWGRAMRSVGSPGSPATVRVYTHFPYCESSCDFCMYFHRVPESDAAYARYADHLVGLVSRFRERCGPVRASSAYFGGGTPSAMPRAELARYLEAFRECFEIAGEFTVEVHPRSADPELVALLARYGVNRISMGIQSLEPAVLRTITRKNRPLEEIARFVAAGRTAGIVMNVDLCLGLPEQSLESFRRDVRALLEVAPDVITLYRYQPVARLPAEPTSEMSYRTALDARLQAAIEASGYLSDALGNESMLRLMRADSPSRRGAESDIYALFGETPSHLIGFGPGAYAHIFGFGWFRDVTSMDALGAERATYWGSRLTTTDEYRQALLDAIARAKPLDIELMDRTTGVSGEAVFGEQLATARRLGLLGEGPALATAEEQAAIVDQLVPSLDEAESPPLSPPHEPALVVLRTKRGHSEDADAALVRRWCEVLDLPGRGHRFFGAIVRDIDDRSVYFSVGSAKATPLRVFVRPPGKSSLYETASFGLSYAGRPAEPITDDEKRFFVFLARRTRLADAT